MKTADSFSPPALAEVPAKVDQEFLARGLAASARVSETGVSISAEASLARLRALAATHAAHKQGRCP